MSKTSYFAGVALIALSISSGSARAQETPVAADPNSDVAGDESPTPRDEGIIVTGTRLRSGLTAPTPVTVSSSEELNATQPSLLSESLVQLPVFKGSSRPSTAQSTPARDNGAAYLNLRGLGKERTLVLLDGRRMVSSSSAGVPDINLLPQDLVSRVEVVTGGASAAYGSDAVAGVVNFILDRTFDGLQISADAGVSDYGDGAFRKFAITGGTEFGGGNGHLIASAEYYKSDRIPYFSGRGRLQTFPGTAPTGAAAPSRAIYDNVYWSMSYGGLITSGPLNGMQFLPSGQVAPFNFGTNRTTISQVGGDGVGLPYDQSPDLERYVGFLRGQYKFGDIEFYAEAQAGQSETNFEFQYHQAGITATSYTIFADNAFLSQSIRDAMAASGTASFSLRRISRDFGYITGNNRSRTWRGLAGVDWDISPDWELNGYYMHGENRLRIQIGNTPIVRNLYAAVDAVMNPANGQIVCRSTFAGLDPGCVPLNLFGEGAPSAAAIDYISGTSQSDLLLRQDVASLSVRGSFPGLPAGRINVAAGAEYRREAASQTADALSLLPVTNNGVRGIPASLVNGLPGAYHFTVSQPLKGSYDIREGFVEAEVPILKDTPGFQSLSINGAARIIDYSTVGTVFTWKAGISYEPFADLRLRATRSRDIRAANIQELFTGQILAPAVILINGVSTPVLGIRSGNPNLAPEKANTLTVGGVYRPSFVPGFSLSIDYYRISLGGAIQQLTNQQTVDQCAAGSALACSQIGTDSSGQVTVRTPTLNLASIKTAGVDFEMNYSIPVSDGRLSFRALASYLDRLSVTVPGAAAVDRAGDIGVFGTPKWSGSLLVNLDLGDFSAFVQERYIGKGRLDTSLAPTVLGPDDKVGSVFYTDATIKYKVDGSFGDFELSATVNNLFNRKPPIAPTSPFGIFRPTNPALYDIAGRFFSVGAKIRF